MEWHSIQPTAPQRGMYPPRVAAKMGNKHRGFSLVELLVVVLVVGLAISLAVLAVGDGAHAYDTRWVAGKLRSTIELAAEEATLSGNNLALGFLHSDTGQSWHYRWYRQTGAAWLPINNDKVFRSVVLPENIDIAIASAEELSALGLDDSAMVNKPQIYFFAGGEITPFQLSLSNKNGDAQYRIQGDMLGRIEMNDENER